MSNYPPPPPSSSSSTSTTPPGVLPTTHHSSLPSARAPIPESSTDAREWAQALHDYFGVGVGLPHDWYTEFGTGPDAYEELRARFLLLRNLVLSSTVETFMTFLFRFDRYAFRGLSPTDLVCHTGNFIFAMNDPRTPSDGPYILVRAVNLTAPHGRSSLGVAAPYYASARILASEFMPRLNWGQAYRFTLSPISDTFGMAVRVTLLHDESQRALTTSLLSIAHDVSGNSLTQLKIKVYTPADLGHAVGLWDYVFQGENNTIAESFGLPRRVDLFVVRRYFDETSSRLGFLRFDENHEIANVRPDELGLDRWPGRPRPDDATFRELSRGGLILAADPSESLASVFQVVRDEQEGPAIEVVPMTRSARQRPPPPAGAAPFVMLPDRNVRAVLCRLTEEMFNDFNKPFERRSRFSFIDATYDVENSFLYVAYQELRYDGTQHRGTVTRVVRIRRELVMRQTVFNFADPALVVYENTHQLARHYSYSFWRIRRALDTRGNITRQTQYLVVAIDNANANAVSSTGYYLVNLANAGGPLEYFHNSRAELDVKFVVPRAYDSSFVRTPSGRSRSDTTNSDAHLLHADTDEKTATSSTSNAVRVRVVRSGGIAGQTTFDTGVIPMPKALRANPLFTVHFKKMPPTVASETRDGFSIAVEIEYADGSKHQIVRDEDSPDLQPFVQALSNTSSRIRAKFR